LTRFLKEGANENIWIELTVSMYNYEPDQRSVTRSNKGNSIYTSDKTDSKSMDYTGFFKRNYQISNIDISH